MTWKPYANGTVFPILTLIESQQNHNATLSIFLSLQIQPSIINPTTLTHTRMQRHIKRCC